MPLLSQSSVGAVSVTSSSLNRVGDLTVSADTFSAELFVDNLPNLAFWAVQGGVGVPLEITPQVALRSEDGAGLTPELEYINLSAPIIMPAIGTPLLLNFQFPAAFMRLKITYTEVAPTTQNINFILNAFGP
jgi:hypothetical protein